MVNMGKLLKRFGDHIYNVHVNYGVVAEMDWNYYRKKMEQYKEKKIVYVVPIDCWSEDPLCGFFTEAYEKFGFEKYIVERTFEYMKLKEQMGFFGFPDFLVLKKGKWERLEVESFSSSFNLHPGNYAEYLLCFDVTTAISRYRVKTFTVREFFGCQEIIHQLELAEFLYVYDREFTKDYHERMMQAISAKTRSLKMEKSGNRPQIRQALSRNG